MRPTPLQKTPQISPIFKADKVTLHVSREKDGKLRLVYAWIGRCQGRIRCHGGLSSMRQPSGTS